MVHWKESRNVQICRDGRGMTAEVQLQLVRNLEGIGRSVPTAFFEKIIKVFFYLYLYWQVKDVRVDAVRIVVACFFGFCSFFGCFFPFRKIKGRFYNYLSVQRAGYRKACLVVHSESIRDNSFSLKCKKFWLAVREKMLPCEDDQILERFYAWRTCNPQSLVVCGTQLSSLIWLDLL